MKPKLKECSQCKQQRPIWKAKAGGMGPFCKDCYMRHQKALESRSEGLELANKKMYSLRQWKEKKKRSPIAPISAKKAKELAEYRKLRDEYMKKHPACEVCGTTRNLTLHHKKTRQYHLCDVSVFMCCCFNCHERIHRDDAWARSKGYLLNSR